MSMREKCTSTLGVVSCCEGTGDEDVRGLLRDLRGLSAEGEERPVREKGAY